MRAALIASLVFAITASADVPVQRVADDAKVVDRVAEVSKKDLPTGLLKRLVTDDIELLRGKRADGSYEYATHERLESGRVSSDFSINAPKKNEEDLQKVEIKGSFVYRLIVSSPTRRMVVTHNRKVYLDRVEIEYIPSGVSTTKTQTFTLQKWIAPGELIPLEIPDVARQATARLYARADKAEGYGNVVLALVEAKVVDNADSPYADAVAAARAILRGVENEDVGSIRAMAARMYDSLAPKLTRSAAPQSVVDVVASRPATPAAAMDAGASADVYRELQEIEDLLTGTDSEKKQGSDRLHQLIRRLRPR